MQSCKWFFRYRAKLKWLAGPEILVRVNYSSRSDRFKLNILFFGTDHFSIHSLRSLDQYRQNEQSTINRIDVVTSFKGQGNPVKKYAEANDMNCRDWITLNATNTPVKYDLGIVVSFGHLIPEQIINMFPLGMINVHASLLPRWRGASPIIYAILNEDATTGVSIMKILPHKFDTGEILQQKEIAIPDNVLMPELHRTLAAEGAELLVNVIDNAPDSLQNVQDQGDENITYAPKVPDSMTQINWQEMSARYIYNLYRALYSFKWLSAYWHKRRIKIREIDLRGVEAHAADKQPGCVEFSKSENALRIYCRDGHFIRVKKLSLEGKTVMTAADFNNGFLKKVPQSQRLFT